MKTSLNNRGFTIVEGVLLFVGLVIVLALAVTFYNVATKQPASVQSDTSEQVVVPDVQTTSDLDAVSKDLDQLNFEDTDDSALLDAQQTAF